MAGAQPARIACLLVAVLPLIAAAVAAPVVDLSSQPPRPLSASEQRTAQQTATADAALRVAERRAIGRLDEVGERTHFAVSALDQETQESFHHGKDRFRTASLVKIHLAALVLWRADRSGGGLTDLQRQDIRDMLVRSENDPALRAYYALGGPAGIERALEDAFGEARIRVGDFSYWGHSTTQPRDVVVLLDKVLSDSRPSRSRYALLQQSMASVVPDQRWGITAMADDGSDVQVKVGWVESPTGWVVNSSGRVLVDGSPVLVSVMTDGNPTLEAGIAATEDVATAVGDVLRARRDHALAISRSPGRPDPCPASGLSTSPC